MPTVDLRPRFIRNATGNANSSVIVGDSTALMTTDTSSYVEMYSGGDGVTIGNFDGFVIQPGFEKFTLPGGAKIGDPGVLWSAELVSYGYRVGGGAVGVYDNSEGANNSPKPTVWPVGTIDVSGWNFFDQQLLGDHQENTYGWASRTMRTVFSGGGTIASYLFTQDSLPFATEDPNDRGFSPFLYIADYPPGSELNKSIYLRIAYLAIRITYTASLGQLHVNLSHDKTAPNWVSVCPTATGDPVGQFNTSTDPSSQAWTPIHLGGYRVNIGSKTTPDWWNCCSHSS